VKWPPSSLSERKCYGEPVGDHLPGCIVGIALYDQLHIVLGAIRGIALDDNPLGPARRAKVAHHLAKQGIFWLILRMAFGSHQPKRHGQVIRVPVGNQQGKTHPEKPGVMLTFPAFLGQWILRAPLRLLTAVPHEREGSVAGRRQGGKGFLGPPLHQQMDIPIARLQKAAETPDGDRGRCPAGQFFQGFPPWEKGLHEDQPTQDETMTAFPDARHPAKQERDKKGHICDRDHDKPPYAKGGGDHALGIPAVLFYHMSIATLICKAL
jgi:hypothetical protein